MSPEPHARCSSSRCSAASSRSSSPRSGARSWPSSPGSRAGRSASRCSSGVPVRATGDGPSDPGRRRFLTLAGLGSFAWLLVGGALGRATRSATFPDPMPIQDAMANDLGAEYMELVRRAVPPGALGRAAAGARPLQQRELRAGVARPGDVLPRHQPRLGVDVPRARPAGRARARPHPAVGRHHARHARRHRSHDGDADGLRRLAGGSSRERRCPASPPARHRRSSSRS